MTTNRIMLAAMMAAMGTLIGSAAMAGGVDGKIEAGDGYNEVYSVSWTASDDNDTPFSGGELHLKRDQNGKIVQAAIKLPTAFVDNTYGTGSTTGYGMNGEADHTFNELLGSDRLNVTLYDGPAGDGGTSTIAPAGAEGDGSIKLDYIAAVGTGSGMSATVDGYRSAGVRDKDELHMDGDKTIVDKADGAKVDAGDPLDLVITDVATSLEHNLAQFTDPTNVTTGGSDDGIDLTTDSPTLVDNTAADPGDYQFTDSFFDGKWETALIWEFSIDPTAMVMDLLPTDGHASPSRLGGNESLIDPNPELVPEPASFVLLGGAALCLVSRRRRRRL